MSPSPENSKSVFYTGGTLPGKAIYIRRRADDEFLGHLMAGRYCYVLTTRQMGKSSLMASAVRKLTAEYHAGVAAMEIGDLGKSRDGQPVPEETWFYGLVRRISRELDLTLTREWWTRHETLPRGQMLTEFFEDFVFPQVKGRIFIFFDEIDSMIGLSFADDFFVAIRSFFNARATKPEFERLTIAMLGVASPTDLIADKTRTPFNVGHRVELTDFTLQEAQPFADALSADGEDGLRQLQRVLHWTGGHPYLTQKTCALVAELPAGSRSDADIDNVVATNFLSKSAIREDDNLKFAAARLTSRAELRRPLLALYRRVLKGDKVPDAPLLGICNELKLSGVVRVAEDGSLEVRSRIYTAVFDEAWVRQNTPVNVPVTAMAAVVALVAFLGFAFFSTERGKREREEEARFLAERAQLDERIKRVRDLVNTIEKSAVGGFAVANTAYESLRKIPGLQARAKVVMNEFLDRQVVAASADDDRDRALLYRLQQLRFDDTPLVRRQLSSLISSDYPALRATYRSNLDIIAAFCLPSAGSAVYVTKSEVVGWDWEKEVGSRWARPRRSVDPKLDPKQRAPNATKGGGNAPSLPSPGAATETKSALAGSPSAYGGVAGIEQDFIAASISEDRRWLAALESGGIVQVWNTGTQEVSSYDFKISGRAETFAMNRDGRRLLVATDSKMVVLNLDASGRATSRRELSLEAEKSIGSVLLSPSGRWLAVGVHSKVDDSVIRLWDLADPAKMFRDFPKQQNRAAAFSRDEKFFAAAGKDGVRLLRTDLGEANALVREFKTRSFGADSIAFSANGRWLAMGGDEVMRIWDLQSSDASAPRHLFFSDSPEKLVFVGDRLFALGRTTHIWNLKAPDPKSSAVILRSIDAGRSDSFYDVTDDGQCILTASGNLLRSWLTGKARPAPSDSEALSASVVAEFFRDNSELDISEDGRWVAYTGPESEVQLFDLRARDSAVVASLPFPNGTASRLFSSPSRWLALRCEGNKFLLWDRLAPDIPGSLRTFDWDLPEPVRTEFSNNERWFAMWAGGSARIWNLEDRDPSTSSPAEIKITQKIEELRFSGNGTWLACRTDKDFQLFRNEYPARRFSLTKAVAGKIGQMWSMDPQDKYLASEVEGAVEVWNLQTGDLEKPVWRLPARAAPRITPPQFSPNGRWLELRNADDSAQLWDLQNARPETTGRTITGGSNSLGFSADSQFLISSSERFFSLLRLDSAGRFVRNCWMLQGAIVVGMTAMADEKGIGAISISGTGSLIAEAMDSQFSDFAAATGEPAALLEDWQKRLSLRFDEKGALPPRRRPAAAE